MQVIYHAPLAYGPMVLNGWLYLPGEDCMGSPELFTLGGSWRDERLFQDALAFTPPPDDRPVRVSADWEWRCLPLVDPIRVIPRWGYCVQVAEGRIVSVWQRTWAPGWRRWWAQRRRKGK